MVPQCSLDTMCRQYFKECLQDTPCSIYHEQKNTAISSSENLVDEPECRCRFLQQPPYNFKDDTFFTAQWFLFNQASVSLHQTFFQLSLNSYTVIIIIKNIYRRKKIKGGHVRVANQTKMQFLLSCFLHHFLLVFKCASSMLEEDLTQVGYRSLKDHLYFPT